MSGPVRFRLFVGGFVMALLGVATAWYGWPKHSEPSAQPPSTNDPRLSYSGPFQNVRPDVKYVGDAACAGCHAEQCDSFSRHPMGQAMATVAVATPIERLDPKAHNPFQGGDLRYEVRRDAGRVVHREWAPSTSGPPVAEIAADVHYACGSGAKARSYIVDRDGYLFQSPATWFVGGSRWDLSPSYEIRNWHFTRAVTPGCLFCHCNFADHVPGTANRYRAPVFHGLGIGCERCHGPGELHVSARKQGEKVTGTTDFTIVNPARLEHHLREAICQQCHLQCEERVVGKGRTDWDFRPGLPLHPFLMDFVDAREAGGGQKFVNSVEQMMVSRCYRESQEPKKLGCTSCHDPHSVPAGEAAKVTHYRSRCLNCHGEQSCSVPAAARRKQQPDDNCVACHMPQTGSEVSHASITDHGIPRLALKKQAGAAARRSTPGPHDLVPFHRNLIQAGDPDVARNLGMVRMAMLNRGMPPPVAKEYASAALPLLDEATMRDTTDWPAVQARADALWLLDRKEQAWAVYQQLAGGQPDSERGRFGAGSLALEIGRPMDARAHLEQAIKINPWRAHYYHELAVACFRLGDWKRAEDACAQALRLEPTRTDTRSLLIQVHLWNGYPNRAEAALDVLRQLTPPKKLPDLERWYQEERQRVAK